MNVLQKKNTGHGNRGAPEREKLKKRMEPDRAAMHQDSELNETRADKILRDWAAELALNRDNVQDDQACLSVVEFLLAREIYAMELTCIREVYPLREFTPLPCTPAFITGIMNIRGRIVSIVDLKKLFDLPEKEITNLSRVIILSSDHMEFGILADAVSGVRNIPLNTVQPSLPTLTGIREQYLRGVTGDRVVILDGEKILADPDMVVR